jgi:hypothetical protein
VRGSEEGRKSEDRYRLMHGFFFDGFYFFGEEFTVCTQIFARPCFIFLMYILF